MRSTEWRTFDCRSWMPDGEQVCIRHVVETVLALCSLSRDSKLLGTRTWNMCSYCLHNLSLTSPNMTLAGVCFDKDTLM